MPYIKTTCGKLVMVDLEDFKRLPEYNYYILKKTGRVQRGIYSKKLHKNTGTKGLAHDVLKVPSSKVIIFLNGNKLDCRRKNLKVIDKSKKTYRHKLSKANTTGYRGVSFDENNKKFVASIRHKGKKYHLGSFKSAELAAAAYNEAAVKYFGKDLAILNIV